MKFEYNAINAKGDESSGVMDAESKDQAINKLRGCGLFPTRVEPFVELNSEDENSQEEKQTAEKELLECFDNLSKTLADPKIMKATTLTDIKKANIMAQLTGILSIIEDNVKEEKMDFSDETIGGVFDIVKSNTVLSNLFIAGGLSLLAETVKDS